MKKLVISALLSLSITPTYADTVGFLFKDKDALDARTALIMNAKEEIIAEYFSVTDDDISTAAISLLCDASKRGIKVKVLLDSLSSSVKTATMHATTTQCRDKDNNLNLEFKLFNPFKLTNIKNVVYRTHEKLLIADKEIMITGGRNVDNKYFGLNKKRNFNDLDIIIRGESVKVAHEYISKLWERKDILSLPNYENFNPKYARSCKLNTETNEKCLYEKSIEESNKAKVRLDELFNGYKSKYTLKTETYLDNGIEIDADKISFLSSDANKDIRNDEDKLSDQLYDIFKKAKRRVLILSPYLIPNNRVKELFRELKGRGVEITIITNSLKSTDNLFAQAGFKEAKDEMIKMGIELYEYNVVDTAHAKTAVIDDEINLIGTFNLDPRSSRLNREIGVKVVSTELANELTSIIQNFKERSLLVGKDGLEVNKDKQGDGVSKFKKVTVHFLEVLVPLIKNQL